MRTCGNDDFAGKTRDRLPDLQNLHPFSGQLLGIAGADRNTTAATRRLATEIFLIQTFAAGCRYRSGSCKRLTAKIDAAAGSGLWTVEAVRTIAIAVETSKTICRHQTIYQDAATCLNEDKTSA